ncbi:MAG: 3'(2'),5'-bisphosphate nucleotidase CysQ [Acidimicrobiia bacterium]
MTADDHRLAAEIAREAGEMLVAMREESDDSGRSLAGAADRRSDGLIHELLAAHRPADAVLSEESADDRRRLTADRVWIVDPLDGSREYGEQRADWAVHVALVMDHGVVAAAVTLPATGHVYVTDPAPAVPPPAGGGRVRIVASRSRPPAMLYAVAQALDAEVVSIGSAGAKTMAVVRGEVDAYLHAGGQYEWDSAAPVGVALAAGLHACRLDGSPLRYNQPDPYLPDQLVCRPELAEAILAAVRAAR